MAVYIVAGAGSSLIRIFGESDINENATQFLDKEIDVEEATRTISDNFGYYFTVVTIKATCDAILVSLVGRQLYCLFKHLWKILKPLFKSSVKAFMDGIKESFKCIQESMKKLINKGVELRSMYDKACSIGITGVLVSLESIQKTVVCAETGLERTVQFELTKYYLEIRGLIRALCEKFNINFLKYVPKPNEELNSNENHMNGKHKDEPLKHFYEIPLEQLLHGTERQLQITREIRESNKITREERQIYTITIEPGCKEEHITCLAEVGDQDPINIPADLLITIRSKPHPLYRRQDADLIYTKTISYITSCSNEPIQIPLLDGKTATVNAGGIITHNTELSVPGQGLPNPDNAGARGRLLIRFNIQPPTNQIHCDIITITETVHENLVDQFD